MKRCNEAQQGRILSINFPVPQLSPLISIALDKARGKLGSELNSSVLSRQEPLKATVSEYM